MPRLFRFTYMCNQDERRMLDIIAGQLHRSRSDAIRLLVRMAVQDLNTKAKIMAEEKKTESGEHATAI